MGQPEGSGCYCAANSILTGFLEKLSANYPYIVMDNEAGMEHISRLTTRNVNVLLLVTDASRRGLQAAVRIHELARELNIVAGKSCLIMNQAKGEPDAEVLDIIRKAGIELAGVIREDQTVYEYDLKGKPTVQIPDDNPAVRAAFEIFDRIID